MNKVVLIGRLTKDPELRFTPGDGSVAVTTFTIAVNRNFKNKNGQVEADFINIVAYRRTAEVIANNFTKGRQIAISGRIQTRSYEGNDGQRRYVTEVIAEDFQFIDKKESGSAPGGRFQSDNIPDFGAADDGFSPVDGEDDIPF